MKRNNILCIVFVLLFGVLGTTMLRGAIPAEERAALIAFYQSTGGDTWTINRGWKEPPLHGDGFAMPGSEGDWYGVTVTDGHVTVFGMMYNNLTGSMPPELGDLSKLKTLVLADNYTLSGNIPPELGKLSRLELFQASVNQLSGPLPPELGNLTKLKGLRLYANELSGPLPAELGNLTALEDMMMGLNRFTGGIPSSFGNLTNIEYLDFYGNSLDGTIPPELGNLPNLTYLGLYWNALKGEIPVTFVNLVSTDIRIAYNALYTDDDTLRTFLNANAPGWDNSQTIAPANVAVTPESGAAADISWTPILYSWDDGGYEVYYRESSSDSWNLAGTTLDKSVSFFRVTNLENGKTYFFKVRTRTDPNSKNFNTVYSEFCSPVCSAIGSQPPFGSFDTPLNNATVMSSIPVTGWALDDFGVSGVKIYRKAWHGEPHVNGMVYIGDADFVEGARPDVAAAYPDYPNNNRAGWGYMLLTNTLPDGGNGTYILYARATDFEGNIVTLGSKTLFCDNANGIEPFGAIDTPLQGGVASGNAFVNFGWVLTPFPNTIPIDGSTITVWVDGMPLGHPVYNQYRADIADLFPQLNNSQGAVGYFYLDTTAYENGAHTIQWTATDDAGNTDGIGSRYFTVQNPLNQNRVSDNGALPGKLPPVTLFRLPMPDSGPVLVQTGYNSSEPARQINSDTWGVFKLQIPETGRIEIQLDNNNGSSWTGYSLTKKGMDRLPVGSTLDHTSGIFYWQPCAGFLGEFRLIFLCTDKNGELKVKRIDIKIY